jgi:hypothetical protein
MVRPVPTIGSAPTLTAGAVVLRAAALVAAGAVVLVVMLGLGWLVTHVEPETPLGAADLGIDGWLAAHRTPLLDTASQLATVWVPETRALLLIWCFTTGGVRA